MSRYRRNPDGTLDKVAGSPYPAAGFIGATSTTNGKSGDVPTPLAGQENDVLFGDGEWHPLPQTDHIDFPEESEGLYLKDDGTFDDVKNPEFGHEKEIVEDPHNILTTTELTVEEPITLGGLVKLLLDAVKANIWDVEYSEESTLSDFIEALNTDNGYIRCELRMLFEASSDSTRFKTLQGLNYPTVFEGYYEYNRWRFFSEDYYPPFTNDVPSYIVSLRLDIQYDLDPSALNPFTFEIVGKNDEGYDTYWHDLSSDEALTGDIFKFIGIGQTEQLVHRPPSKFLREDGEWIEPESNIDFLEEPSGRVFQDDGTFGKKLQMDIVIQNGEYGYIGANDTFIPFKSQADIDAAVTAAKVGTATAADVLAGKTFTNNSASGLTGTFEGQEKTVTVGDSVVTVNPDSGKWLRQVNVKPAKTLSIGKLKPSKNLYHYEHGWSNISWGTYQMPNGFNIWTDGNNIYYSQGSNQYIIDVVTLTLIAKEWFGLPEFDGYGIWTDGNDIYYSNASDQYVLDTSTSTWSEMIWNGLTSFRGDDIWTDGNDIYYSSESDQYILDATTHTWTPITWNGISSFIGRNVWTNGSRIFMSAGSSYQYVLDVTTHTLSEITWNGTSDINGYDVWTDGNNIYYTMFRSTYLYDDQSNSWTLINDGSIALQPYRGREVWSDGINMYYNYGSYSMKQTISKTQWII